MRKSEWLGFPPIATTRSALARREVQTLQQAFMGMAENAQGKLVLRLLHLDGFAQETSDLFDTIAAKANLVKHLG